MTSETDKATTKAVDTLKITPARPHAFASPQIRKPHAPVKAPTENKETSAS